MSQLLHPLSNLLSHYLKQILPIDLIKLGQMFGRRQLLQILRINQAASALDLFKFSRSESINVSAPICPNGRPDGRPDELPAAIQQRIGTFELSQPSVCVMSNARLIGDRATGFSADGQLITQTAVPSFYGLEQSSSIRAMIRNALVGTPLLPTSKLPTFNEAFSLVNPWSHNYFHWLIDCLPRLEGCEYYRAQTQRRPKLIVPQSLSAWQADSLRLIGYSPEDCIHWTGEGALVERLVVSSFRRDSLSVLSPAACRWLRDRLVPSVPLSRHPLSTNIVISRRKATGRRLVNEDQVMQLLSPLGFVAYTLEEMSFAEQVALFAQAKTIVSPHGAGLVNMIFSEGARVVELFSSPVNPIFFTLANALDFEYACIPCQARSKKYNSKRNDILVDISALKSVMEKLL